MNDLSQDSLQAPPQPVASSQVKTEPQRDDRPSILFASPMNVLDITSGASLSMRTLLAAMAAKGFRAVALQATMFDSPQGGAHVLKAGEVHKDKKILRTHVLGVEHIILRTAATFRPLMTCGEQELFLRCFREELRRRRPDMVILWGALLLEMTVMREAREAGIPVIFYLVNSGYKEKEAFRYASVVVTDTQATADLYKERFGMDCKPTGKFIDVGLIKAPVRRPEFMTFINPSFEKGVNVFMPLAKLAARECPEIKFLVVQSRGRWATALKVLKLEASDFPNVKVIGHQRDMRPVYAATRALLLPSLWFESGARVIPEALLNGVPILASDTGGSRELVGQGGVMFTLPEEVREKRGIPAGEEVLRPWLEEVKRIWHDEAYYAELARRAAKEGENHDIQHSTARFLNAVLPYVPRFRAAPSRPAPATDAKSAVKQALTKKQERLAQRNRKRH